MEVKCVNILEIVEQLGKRDASYGLEGMIEFDEGYFEKATKEEEWKKLKRGKVS